MQYQVQEVKNAQKELDSLDLYVGLHSDLTDPFNVFVKVSDLEENRPLVYFYAYSMGKKKVVIWGVFDRTNNEFLIDDSCQYNADDLKSIIDSWKKNNYDFFFSSVKDRVAPRMKQNSMFKDRKYDLNLMEKFRQSFMQKLIQSGNYRGKNIVFDEEEYQKLLDKIAQEAVLAILDRRDYDKSIRLLVDELDTLEDENLVLEALNYKNIKKLNLSNYPPYIQKIIKFILVNVFILVFLKMEEYRVAKYIDYLSKHKESAELRNYVKGKFLYEWIYELAKVFRIENIKLFMKKYAEDILRLTEKEVNLTDVGVIGNRAGKSYKAIEDMALFFEEFISKSEYSKISYTNSLPLCPHVFIEQTSMYDLT